MNYGKNERGYYYCPECSESDCCDCGMKLAGERDAALLQVAALKEVSEEAQRECDHWHTRAEEARRERDEWRERAEEALALLTRVEAEFIDKGYCDLCGPLPHKEDCGLADFLRPY